MIALATARVSPMASRTIKGFAGSDGSLDGDYLPDVHRSTFRCTGLLGQPSAADSSTRPAALERRYRGRHQSRRPRARMRSSATSRGNPVPDPGDEDLSGYGDGQTRPGGRRCERIEAASSPKYPPRRNITVAAERRSSERARS
jgi:hypothetical protein